MEIILNTLNEEQRNAAVSTSKYLRITAGPGTGKTTTLAARIFNLQYEHGLSRHEVLAISFSRSAKQQLISKMHSYTEKLGYGNVIEVLTFHSLAHRIIRYGIHHEESKFKKGFQTISTIDYINAYPPILNGLCSEYPDKELVGKAISQGFNLVRQGQEGKLVCETWSDIDVEEVYNIEVDATYRVKVSGKDLVLFWQRIERLEKEKNITDFQGLITEAIRLLNKRSYTYEAVTNELKHILVDEYQDTSLSQEGLLFSLAGNDKEITVVGDKNQTIYTFNGSNDKNLDRFISRCESFSPNSSEQIKLKKNYRSTGEIINLSNQFIGEEIIIPTKEKSDNEPVLINTQSTKLAGSYIASEIQSLCRVNQFSYKDICILFRKNSQFAPHADDVIEALKNYNIPYHDGLIRVDEKIDLEAKVQELSDNYPGVSLDEILVMIKRTTEDKHLVEFILNSMAEGAEDAEDLLDLLIEFSEPELDSNENKVTIQSVHAAKGQEYPIVFITFVGDRDFPHGSRPNMAEEKRLLYVGITRAMEQLYILGQHGIQHGDFLGQCKSPTTNYQLYSSNKKEVKGDGFSEKDAFLIRETNEGLKEQEIARQKNLEDLMNEW